MPLTDILKHTIKSLIRDCAFKHGYIPVERQTECLLRILISSAEKLNQPYYTERVKTDPLIQRVICDMVGPLCSCIQILIQMLAQRTCLAVPDKCQARCLRSRDSRIWPFRRQIQMRTPRQRPSAQRPVHLSAQRRGLSVLNQLY